LTFRYNDKGGLTTRNGGRRCRGRGNVVARVGGSDGERTKAREIPAAGFDRSARRLLINGRAFPYSLLSRDILTFEADRHSGVIKVGGADQLGRASPDSASLLGRLTAGPGAQAMGILPRSEQASCATTSPLVQNGSSVGSYSRHVHQMAPMRLLGRVNCTATRYCRSGDGYSLLHPLSAHVRGEGECGSAMMGQVNHSLRISWLGEGLRAMAF
jgi:hypothetical protein